MACGEAVEAQLAGPPASRAIAWATAFSVAVLLLVYVVLTFSVMAPDSFLSGDSGSKLLQIQGAYKNGPFTPWVEGLSIDIDPALENQEWILVKRGAHMIGQFPWLLSLVSMPFYGAFGLRGVYVFPAISVVAIFLAACRLGGRMRLPAGGLWTGWCAVAATPLVVYGAELWEHATAVAFTTIAAVLVLPRDGDRADDRRTLAAGACIAIGGAFRPEALMVGPAFVLGRLAARGWRAVVRTAVLLAAGAFVPTVVVAIGDRVVFGAFLPQHISGTLSASMPRYVELRLESVRALLLPVWDRKIFVAAVAAILALAVRPGRSGRRLWTLHALVVVLLVVGFAVPHWRFYTQQGRWIDVFGYISLAHTWPFLFVLAYWLTLSGPARAEDRFLFVSTVAFIGMALMLMPGDGGAQWGGRFLLPAAPWVAALVSKVAWAPDFHLDRRQLRQVRAMSLAVLGVAVWTEIYGLMFLAEFKGMNSGITAATARLTDPGEVIITDLYWFPQVTATLYSTRRELFAHGAADVNVIAGRAARAGFARLSVVTSTPLTAYTPPATLIPAGGGPPFVQTAAHDLGARSLMLYKYERAATGYP